jgi:hypothetical protein
MAKDEYDLKNFSEIKIPKSVKNIPRCDWCNKPLPKRHVSHHNQMQDPPVHNFCSKQCKEKWCHDQN